MGKKKKHPEHENLERWLVSYADFITLLFATFTALYAIAQADLAKMEDVGKAISQGFEEQSLIHGVRSVIKSGGEDSPGNDGGGQGDGVIGAYKSLTYSPGEVERAQETYDGLKGAVDKINAEIQKGDHPPSLPSEGKEADPKGIDVAIQERGLKVSLDSRLLFKPGGAELRQESMERMEEIAKRLKKADGKYYIHVEGHTDNQPIVSARYPSNWELSSARASTVVRLLISEYKFDPGGLVAVGYGDSRPIAKNETAEGRRKNRRVDIILYSRRISSQTDPKLQYNKERTLIRYEERDANNQVIKPVLLDSQEEGPRNTPASIILKNPAGEIEKVITPIGSTVVDSIKPDLKDDAKDNEHNSGH